MSWNYRVVKQHFKETGEDFFGIHETYYDDNGNVKSITVNSVRLIDNSLEKLRHSCQMMLSAFENPVLNYEDFKLREYSRLKK